jgi:multidrug efflux pump subunit AcrB
VSDGPDASTDGPAAAHGGGFVNAVVRTFLHSNLSMILVLLAAIAGLAALLITPREEDPQIVVPLADVHVEFPGHSAAEVEQLVAAPLERLLYQIDGVEYVYSMSMPDRALITVRFYVGEDRERSLVKLYKRIDEHVDIVPPGVTGWVVKPVEIDDVPIVTVTLTGPTDDATLRRVAEELVERLAAVENTSRAILFGGRPREVRVELDPERLAAFAVSPLDVERALRVTNVAAAVGTLRRGDASVDVRAGPPVRRAAELDDLVIGVFDERPVMLRDVATVVDGPAEVVSYVRHGRGPAAGFADEPGAPGTRIGPAAVTDATKDDMTGAWPAVTIALAKKKGTNAVWVAEDVIESVERLKRDVVPDDIELVITRNYGLTADHKVNELVEALAVAVLIVIGLLTLGLGWRESLIVAVAIPVVFGLTLTVNLLAGLTINRVTLFALILSLGLLVDDPIVDVENISRHFALRARATRAIVMEAVAEIRPPLIIATLAVIVSFLPMLFITGMMGPYMRPMALNVPVTMLMSMLVAFTVTPWLAYHVLRRRYARGGAAPVSEADELTPDRGGLLYRAFAPLMRPLLARRAAAWGFLGAILVLTVAAAMLAAFRAVPLKMLPYDNKNELLLVLDLDEGTTLQRSDAAVREMEGFLRTVPEVVGFTSYVGLASPMDFNGLVRHYYLRHGDHVAEIRVDLVGKKSRATQSHALGLRIRDELTRIARRHGATLSVVETPPGPPVLATVVAEIYGRPDHRYQDLVEAASTVRRRLEREPGVVDVDDTTRAAQTRWVFVADREKAALNGVSVDEIARTLSIALRGRVAGLVRKPDERNPLEIVLRVPRAERSRTAGLDRLHVNGRDGSLVPLAELGAWREEQVEQTVYRKNLQRVVYVQAETAGRPPAEVILDVQADREPAGSRGAAGTGGGWVADVTPRPVGTRSFLRNGSDVGWSVPEGIDVDFAGEGEWKITLEVFRDLGLAFAAALVAIYVLLTWQTGSFAIPVVVMLAIPLTIVGIMPGFWLLNVVSGGDVGGYANPVFFTATAMIGMIALAGIVTRNSIILVDFIHLSLARGRDLAGAIVDSCVVRLRPILLTAGTAMLSAVPIIIDPIFSGLAWALIFGLFASTVFTLFVVPLTYWLVYRNRPGHGLIRVAADD